MIEFKSISIRNFQSVGNVTQVIKLNDDGLNLILGENLDQESDYRNGTGKSTLAQAICFSLYGVALTNIKKDNLVNKINNKNMLVSLEFTVDNKTIRIERGRKPAILRLYVEGEEYKDDDNDSNKANGENKNTQIEIEKYFGMSYKLYRQIVSLSSKTIPFLSLREGEQREIIEELLGITLLSKKSEILSNLLKDTKEEIRDEEIRLKTVDSSNERIKSHIADLVFKSKVWDSTQEKKNTKTLNDIEILKKINIEEEIKNHDLFQKITDLEKDILIVNKNIISLDKSIKNISNTISKNKDKLLSIKNNKCPECEQDIHNNKTDEIKEYLLKDILENEKEEIELANQLEIEIKKLETLTVNRSEYGNKPDLMYSNISDAYNHQRLLDSLEVEYKNLLSQTNPFYDQIANLNDSGIQEINFDYLNSKINEKDHQEFLLKLLTKKDSFIRKKIIDQNLSFLNNRLNSYLDGVNLPHIVTFNSDLSVDITKLGKEYDFEQLSSGEQNRLILSLSWAFRDVWEIFNQNVNFYIIDELVDSGMDKQGVGKALEILRKFILERNKHILLISHKGEIENKVDKILMAYKENEFTTYKYLDE